MHKINFYFANILTSDSIGLFGSALLSFLRSNKGVRSLYKSKFEHITQGSTGALQTLAVSANRSGLYALLTALGVGDKDEVIVTGFTCSAVVEPILQKRAKPVYVDIEPETFCLNPTLLEAMITRRTQVIILQHTFGFPAPVDEVMEIANKHGLFVIEDCALALGSKKDGRWLGSFGDAAIWSFELSKTISVGWGGLIGINRDEALAKRVGKILEDSGNQPPLLAAQRLIQGGLSGLLYHHRTPHLIKRYALGALFKFRIFRKSADTPADDLRLPNDRQWKYLHRQWLRLNENLVRSKATQKAYESVLVSHGSFSYASQPAGKEIYLIRFPLLVKNPERIVAFFADRDIEIGRWFNSPVSCNEKSSAEYGYDKGCCPVAERICQHIINLPLHGRLTAEHVAMIVNTLDQYLFKHPDEVISIGHSLII